MINYIFSQNCVAVSSDELHELEGHQRIVIENEKQVITHDFDVVGELKREAFCGLNTVWYQIANHEKDVDSNTRKIEANSDAIDDILCMILEG